MKVCLLVALSYLVQAQEPEKYNVAYNGSSGAEHKHCQPNIYEQLTELDMETEGLHVSLSSAVQDLQATQAGLQNTQSQLSDLKATVEKQQALLDDLKRQSAERPKVAFTAGLGGNKYIGPFNAETTVVYGNVLSNIGSAYSSATGIFTAPVRGVYYFSYYAHGSNSRPMEIRLYVNGIQKVTASEQKSNDVTDSMSNGVALSLERGDQVYTRLLAGTHVWGSTWNHSTFSGFLIYTL